MRRLTILLAALGALLLVPAAQAFANPTVKVEITGTGQGSVTSSAEVGFFGHVYEGTPPIECSYDGKAASGVCENTSGNNEGIEGDWLIAKPSPGFEFAGWKVLEGEYETYAWCRSTPGPRTPGEEEFAEFFGEGPGEGYPPGGVPCLPVTVSGQTHLVAQVAFCKEGHALPEGGCEPEPTGPTNRRTLTLTKSAGTTGGIGTVSSKPKGINCGAACNKAVASMYENQTVVLKAKASSGSSLVGWTGCEAETVGPTEGTCTVAMTEAQEVTAVFGPTSKAILNPQALTLSKGESSGYGTVKAAGLACEAECAETAVLYQGPTGIAPKNKPGKTVTLKETPAFGSEFSAWSGCESNPAPGECVVTMEEATEVKAEFTAKPNVALTLEKAGSGTGTVSSKPKAINCGATCTAQGAAIPSGEAIVLKQKPATGMTFAGWSGGGCSGTAETCTVSPSSATTVTATFTGSPKPIANPQELTLTKEGSGFGTVKAAGLACEALCTQAVSLYQGPTGIAPKNKPGKTVTLKATSAPGTQQVAWTGCESNPTPGECVVTMEEATEVTASFEELE